MIAGLTKAWDRAEIVADLRTALDIVEELDPPSELAGLTFQYAVQLVTQVAARPGLGGITIPAQQL